MRIFYKNKRFEIPVKKVSFFGKFSGLMFRTKETGNLLFDFRRDVEFSLHSFFVFFDFLVLWLDENNKVVDFRVAKPFLFSIRTKKPFRRILEIPINRKNSKIVSFFVGERKI